MSTNSFNKIRESLSFHYWNTRGALADLYCTYIGHNFVKLLMWVIVKLNPNKCSVLAEIIGETAEGYRSESSEVKPRMKTVIKNASFNSEHTIRITEEDPEWTQAYTNWKAGKNPTDSKEWKKGIFLSYENLK
jgi:hypothetical protein